MATFPRVVVSAHGAADVLRYEPEGGSVDALKTSLAEGQILVESKFAGVNFIDTYFRSGLYPKEPPFTNGQEGAGIVAAVGPGVDASKVGKKVAFWGNVTGAYAKFTVVPATGYTDLPDDADLKTAAASILQGLTSHYLVHSTYPVKSGDWVLVHAAAGGCGLLISQMCKNLGATVIGTCSTAEKAQLAKEVGRCDHVINYTEKPDFAAEVRALVPEGVHVVYDGVGKDTVEGTLASLRRRGMFASFGNASGAVPPVAPLRLTKAGSLFMTRPTLADYVADPAERKQRTEDVMGWLKDGKLVSTVGLTLPLAEARAAQEALEGRKTTGKVVLEIA
eukprot:TRINITY_DN3386_c6_g1_i1.p1 TRINITY_DN3386_c6_g1~~TRINITY_DN3386_c6_g1_i1.p1  ORF type:complete len:377 (+),score=152.77 TRINITY_DN3386_c6_g1_i1:127-1131(+)